MGSCYLPGFYISEPTVSRYLHGLKRILDESKASQWRAVLNNHREALAAFDFSTVPNLYFRGLYCFFVIEHARRLWSPLRVLDVRLVRIPCQRSFCLGRIYRWQSLRTALTNIDLQHRSRMAMTPIPIVAALPLVGPFPNRYNPDAVIASTCGMRATPIVPFVIILVLLVVIAVAVVAVVAIVPSWRMRI